MAEISDSDLGDVLQIDIVSDVVCPWCIVGFKQLEQAIHETGISAAIKWHPFELNPDMPQAGENLRDHIMRKYGSTAEQSQGARDRLSEVGKDLGFEFRFADDMRMVNTFKAHQLLHWAGPEGKEHPLKMALFEAYFQDRKDLNDDEILADIAGDVGLDREEALKVLADQRFSDDVRQEEAFWTQNGIQGVPAVIFDRRHLITGAQGVENYTSILKQLMTSD
ncbi:DsbA family oxidoreductase [Roseibium denhamense]|uniref:Predicted dithiol-disulfide isomerase, DsbA family n=1 Tax=Roseibium denhamense TaxID=76305 RepID=A0ABY1NI93_9HYPH|nr:DsbA family oxidoreductase [Roseibium denhamense]MTI05067.1 DsbA family oxidoreductase [Roseibium denhamense]SMP10188.1 Predicted dithiol-disulfide isomerase, DsbA family [Roseibium denhamense]